MTGSTIGRYEVGEKLGAGGMGVVYRAHDTQLRREVALKFLPATLARDPDARARFLREARAASALEHPNIATIYEIGEHEESLFIAMALYEGETLLERMKREALTIEEIEEILRQLLDAAAAAHAAGVVHRDLKPANVILTRPRPQADGLRPPIQIKVVDWGLATLRRDLDRQGTEPSGEDSVTRLTVRGTMLGTVPYMSPEQARGEAIDGRSDLWSIGVIAYEMLTGKHPFEAASSVGTLTRIVTEEPEPLDKLRADVPEHLRRLVVELLRKGREERIEGADAALSILGGSVPRAVWARPRRGSRYRWWLLAAAGILVVIALAVGLPRLLPTPGGAKDTSFVVLPCQVFGAEDVLYLTDGVPSTLSNLLAQVEGLDTRKPPTSVQLDPNDLDLEQVAKAYGVRNCVTCTVTSEGDRILLQVQLVEPRTKRLLWSSDYEGTEGSYITLIRESARGIRDALLPGTPGAVTGTNVAAGSKAELAFQRGKHHSERYNNLRAHRDLVLAKAAFEEALSLDPNLADAAGEIALLFLWSQGEGAIEVREWARRALAIDERCARAWVALAFVEWAGLDPDRSLEYALKAIRYGPEDGLAHYSLYSPLKLGSNSLALEVVRRSTEVSPLYAWGYIGQASALFQQGRVDEALSRLDRALEIQPESYAGNSYRCIFLATAGRLDEAREAYATIEGLADPTPKYLRSYSRLAIDLEGAAPKARDAILQAFSEDRCRSFECVDEAHRFLVPLLLRHGAVDLVIRILEEYADFGMMPAYDWLMLNPQLESLRDDPRFAGIEAAARAQYAEYLERLRAARLAGELPSFLEQPLDDLEPSLGLP